VNATGPDVRAAGAPQAAADGSAQGVATQVFLGFAFAALLALHFLEPDLGLSWSYAHLSRTAWLPWIAAGTVVALPLGVLTLWRRPWVGAAVRSGSTVQAVAAGLVVFALLVALGRLLPAPSTSMDAGLFLGWVEHGGEVARWHLLLKLHQLVANAASGVAGHVTVVRALNAGMAAIAAVALVATARLLGRSNGEAAALAALSLSSMGVLQLCIGYADVYPLPLAATAVYVWASLRVIAGRLHPFWPLLLVAVGPFVYLGLVLLAPSLVVVVWCALC